MTRKGIENLFEIESVRDIERKIGYSLHKGTETLVRDRENQLYFRLRIIAWKQRIDVRVHYQRITPFPGFKRFLQNMF